MIIFYKVMEDLPLVVAANRDELYNRRSTPPKILAEQPGIIGGQDVEAGGTWLGINQHGLCAGIANCHGPEAPPQGKRSRGLLCMDLLKDKGCEDAISTFRKARMEDYSPFFLILADSNSAHMVSNSSAEQIKVIKPGLHVLTNSGFDAEEDPRRNRILKQVLGGDNRSGNPETNVLVNILKDHGTDEREAVCRHGNMAGTRSSTILVLNNNIAASQYYYADGPPCMSSYKDYSNLFTRLL
jgi:uncharacterized protein with NRDE domain